VKAHSPSWRRQCTGSPGLILGYAARTAAELAEAVRILGLTCASSGFVAPGDLPAPTVQNPGEAE
jgi:hypothetical protein